MPLRVVVGIRLLALLTFLAGAASAVTPRLPVHDGVGGDFTALSSLGGELRLSDLRGKVVLLFFGYTSCQDICPANLAHLKAVLKRLGPEADRVRVVLVTVDPENDTPEHLKEYLSRFDPDFIGLAGTPEQMDRIAKLYMVTSHKSHGMKLTTKHNTHKSPVDEAYLYAHSQQIYLLDKRSRVRALYFVGSPIDEMRDAVLALLEEADAAGRAAGVEPADGKALQEHVHHEHGGRESP